MPTKLLSSIMLIALMFSQTFCTSSHISESKINQSAFPAQFGAPGQILLIEKRTSGINAKGMNNYIRKSFQKNYSGAFEMVTPDEIKNDHKYKNTKVYRYVLTDNVWTSGSKVVTTTTNASRTASSTDIQYNYAYRLDFHLYDRVEEKNYPTLGVSSNVPAKAINRTSVILNKKLKS